jgi:hypothetical protein
VPLPAVIAANVPATPADFADRVHQSRASPMVPVRQALGHARGSRRGRRRLLAGLTVRLVERKPDRDRKSGATIFNAASVPGRAQHRARRVRIPRDELPEPDLIGNRQAPYLGSLGRR